MVSGTILTQCGCSVSAFTTVGTEFVLLVANLWSCRKAELSLGISNGVHVMLPAAMGFAGALLFTSQRRLHSAVELPVILAGVAVGLIEIRKAMRLPSLAAI